MFKIVRKIKNLLQPGPFTLKKKSHVYDLLMYDDIYPHPVSGFRMEEFSCYLKQIENSKIIVSGNAYKLGNLTTADHQNHITKAETETPGLKGKFQLRKGTINVNARLFYCVFLSNMYHNLEWLEKFNIPFAFTLYPGGEFTPGTEETAFRLTKIFGSPCFRKVIVTQKKTINYLLEKKLCSEEDITFIFGVVVPQASLSLAEYSRTQYGQGKPHFDICFCAAKYTPLGEDKGYPLFIEFAKTIASKYESVRFHVIGGFDETVINVDELNGRIRFYGYLDYNQLKTVFQSADLILSPNQPDKIKKGSFDGFPLGTIVEAALNGVAVMLTDPFEENVLFKEGQEVIIIKPELSDITEKFEYYFNSLPEFYNIARQGRNKFQQLYSFDAQMKPRLALLNKLIEQEKNKI
jgi:Glycosyl transferases group 1